MCRAGHPGVEQRGIRVVRDALDRWVNSRPIWNQHAYSVTHVDDAGVCLDTDDWEANWTVPGLNNFRQAIAGDPDTVVTPDLTGSGGDFACDEQTGDITLTGRICNRGTEPVGAGIPVTFYEGTPEDDQVLCTVGTAAILAPGECTQLVCLWSDAPDADTLIVTAVADDDGSGGSESTECYEGNNRTTLVGEGCEQID